MSNSYGISPTLNNPENFTGLADIRTSTGSARCCQFFTAQLPPAWYFFSKTSKAYGDTRLGLSVINVGNWRSNLTKLSVTNTPTITDAPNSFEVLQHPTGQPSLVHEFSGTLKVVGNSGFTTGTDPLNTVVPNYIGQTYLDNLGTVWLAVGLTSADWIQISSVGAT